MNNQAATAYTPSLPIALGRTVENAYLDIEVAKQALEDAYTWLQEAKRMEADVYAITEAHTSGEIDSDDAIDQLCELGYLTAEAEATILV